MSEQKDTDGHFVNLERQGLSQLHDIVAIDTSSSNYKYFTVPVDRQQRRIGPCPRGGNWSCHECYQMTLMANTPKPTLICTPYTATDLTIAPYKMVNDMPHYGMFLQETLLEDIGTAVPSDSSMQDMFHNAYDFIYQASCTENLN